jgi:hypothetical protein
MGVGDTQRRRGDEGLIDAAGKNVWEHHILSV